MPGFLPENEAAWFDIAIGMMVMHRGKGLLFVGAVLIFLSFWGRAEGAMSRAEARRFAEEQKEFASFIDGFFAGIRKDRHIPGMVFIAVKDGMVLYEKGYGTRELAGDAEVSPKETLFRIGGISKPVTAAAVLQLVEKGRLEMDTDANEYLHNRWKIPDARFKEPITPRHLLTHTAGFDAKEFEIYAPTSADERAFAGRLQKIIPARYAPPGRSYSESNAGYTLLGAIVERYSRQSFSSAVAKHIFQPLGMKASTFTPNEESLENLATGYDTKGTVIPYAYRYDMPAMGMCTTASDMGRFMLAQLNEGQIGNSRILQPMYANSMLRRHFAPHPKIDGTGLGYEERHVYGIRILQQRGVIPGYSAFLALIPEKRFGFFFAANVSDISIFEDMTNTIARRFLSAGNTAAAHAPPHPFSADPAADDIEGYYRQNRIARHTAEKVMHLCAGQIKATVQSGEIVLTHIPNRGIPASRWRKVQDPEVDGGSDLYRLIEGTDALGGEYLFFQRDADDRITTMVVGKVAHTYDRLEKYEWFSWQAIFLIVFALSALITAIGAGLGVLVNKGKLPWEKGNRAATEFWVIAVSFWLLQGAFALGLLFSYGASGSEFVVFVPYQVKALFVIPLAGGLLLAWFWFRILGGLLLGEHHWAEKLLVVQMAAVQTGYMLFLMNWRLLGFLF